MSELVESRPDAIKLDFSSNSRSMVLAFASIHLEAAVPPFEWTRALAAIPAKKVFVRDLGRRWYLRGIPGMGDSPEEVAGNLRQIAEQQGCTRVVTIGSSMGGYAALLFGCLIAADEVHAFAPPTTLPSRKGRNLAKALWWRNYLLLWHQWKLVTDRKVERRYFDLRPLLERNGGQTTYHVYYSPDYSLDVAHARHLVNLANVILHERLGYRHLVAVAMRDSGELESLLLKAVANQSQVEATR